MAVPQNISESPLITSKLRQLDNKNKRQISFDFFEKKQIYESNINKLKDYEQKYNQLCDIIKELFIKLKESLTVDDVIKF